MLTLRPTQNLAKRLKLPALETAPFITSYRADWGVREVRVGRLRYLLFANTATLFPVVTLTRGAVSVSTLVDAFATGFKAAWERTPAFALFEQSIAPELDEVQFAANHGKSYLGSANDFALTLPYYVASGLSPAICSRRLARTPMTYLGMNSPAEAFAKFQPQP